MPQNHSISLETAIEMTQRYRTEKGKILQLGLEDLLPICETFDKTAFEDLIKQPGCVSVRSYFGMGADRIIRLIFVGVNDKDEDILPPAKNALIVENGGHCPPACPAASALNLP